jgi:hypothetical protein
MIDSAKDEAILKAMPDLMELDFDLDKTEYCSLEEARDWCKLNEISTQVRYNKSVFGGVYNSDGKKLPSSPNRQYKNSGWVSWTELWK